VAQVPKSAPADLARRGAKLIRASLAGLATLKPPTETKVSFLETILVVGGGVAMYGAAQELGRQGIKTVLARSWEDPAGELRRLHLHYPGERYYHERLRQIMAEVLASPLVAQVVGGQVTKVLGRVGEYRVTFDFADGRSPQEIQVGAIIAALDAEVVDQGPEFGHDGVSVLSLRELEEFFWSEGIPRHRLVFWVNDVETGQPYGELSAKAAWHTASFIRDQSPETQLAILYNRDINLPLSTSERVRARDHKIRLLPYDGSIRPIVQSGYITFNRPADQLEQELPWDQLVLSPHWGVSPEVIQLARTLGKAAVEGEFLERHPQVVWPHMVGLDEKLPMAGAARRPCDLREALRQGRQAAKKLAELVDKARAGKLLAPLNVCTVDESRCASCNLCLEICDSSGIQPVEGLGGSVPQVVDPMLCTGAGTCSASCPYLAMSSQIYNTTRHEETAAALVRQLTDQEYLGFGCRWSALPAADHAGLKGLAINPRFYLLPIHCIGQLDAKILGRVFLEGANGLLLMGCRPEECHHNYGLDQAWARVSLVKKLLSLCGLERERLALAHCDLNKPEQYLHTVDSFVATLNRLGPMVRDAVTVNRLRGLYDTLQNHRVRWALGVSLRRPYDTAYPGDQRNALVYDRTLTDIVDEEFFRCQLTSLLRHQARFLKLQDISQALGAEEERTYNCLKELSTEGQVSRIFKNRTPFYSLQ
jgi:coenzyme F420-reducing hydrogenase delta subunit/ferredoxin